MKKQSSSQYSSQQNRDKLMLQNIKLNKEIKVLQDKMSKVITLDVVKAVQADKKNNQTKSKMNQLTIQQAYIKKLKNKVKQLKASNLTDVPAIINEEDQLVALKREYQKLMEEKKLRGRQHDEKKFALEYNNPLNQFKNETQNQLQRIKKKNADMAAKLVELQRQVRKYHKYQQMHKKLKDQKIVIQNPQYEYAKIDHEKANIFKKTKLIEHKWKPQLQALDNEYFQSKYILIRKQKIAKQLQKQLKNWQNRASAVRNQSDVLLDRQRLSKVVVASPEKKQNQKGKSPIKLTQKIQQKSFADFFKSLFTKNNDKDIQKAVKNNLNTSQQLKKQQKPDRRWNNLAAQTRYATQSQKPKQNNEGKYDFTRLSQKNQFMNSKHSFQGFDLKELKPKPEINNNAQIKNNKIVMNSVAVGTSFYYNDED